MGTYVGRHREKPTSLGSVSWALFMVQTAPICPLTLEETYQVRRVTQQTSGGETRAVFYQTQARLVSSRLLNNAARTVAP